jgi:Flp pilus assembly protein TadD
MRRLAIGLALALIALAPAAARAAWHEASSAHFRVYADGSAESVRDFAARLERFDKGLHVLNGLPDRNRGPANRVTVFVVPNVATIQKLMHGRRNVRGFYLPRAEGPLAFTPARGKSSHAGADDLNDQIILLHEYAHHFMLQNYQAAFPAWFVEGFAEFNSTARFRGDGGVDFGLPASHRGRELYFSRGSSVEPLFASRTGDNRGSVAPEGLYGRGWLLTHFLMLEPKRRGQLQAYLVALNRGTPSLEAARAAFGDFRSLDSDLASWSNRAELPGITIAAQALPTGTVTVRPLSPGEAAIMSDRLMFERGIPESQAKTLLPALRKAASPFPTDAAVQAVLARAELMAGNRAEAEAAADRALAAEPANIDALIMKARAFMAGAARGDAAAWREARRRIGAANRVDPDDPEPLILFFRSFLAQGIAPTPNAVTGLLRAFELAPQDRNLRLMVARQYLFDGKAAEARAALAPIAFDPHAGARGAQVRTVLEALDSGGPKAALAAWRALSTAKADEED